MTRIIVVEDDVDLCDLICRYLAATGAEVRAAGSGVELSVLLDQAPADVVVLDINLPDEDGFAIAARLRALPSLRVVVLTGRSHTDDRVMGLLSGADAYLVKPVQFRELEAVITSLMRRLPEAAPMAGAAGTWRLDEAARLLVTPRGRSVSVTAAEHAMLRLLLSRPGKAVARAEIVTAFGRNAADYDQRAIATLVTRLRQKVEEATGEHLPVNAVRSVGYMFAAPVSPSA